MSPQVCTVYNDILSMLGEGNGEEGVGGGQELMVQWFVSWTPDQ